MMSTCEETTVVDESPEIVGGKSSMENLPNDDCTNVNPSVEPEIKKNSSNEESPSVVEAANKPDTGETIDVYSYTHREGFTSEIFKIELKNLMYHVQSSQLKNFIIAKGLKPRKVKVMKLDHETKAYVSFTCEEDREAAIERLNGFVWKSRPLMVKKALPKADPLVLKRKYDQDNAGKNETLKGPPHTILQYTTCLQLLSPLFNR